MNKKLLALSIGLVLSKSAFALDHPPTDGDFFPEPCTVEPCPTPTDHPTLADFGVSEEQVCAFDQLHITRLPPHALGAFKPSQFQCIPPSAFGAMTPEQMQNVQADALEKMTPAQFIQLPPQALQGLHHGNMDHLPPGIIKQMGTEHVGQLNVQEFQQMSSKGMTNLIINLDPALIVPSIVKGLLPEGWDIQEDGTLVIPPLSEIGLPALPQEQTGCVGSSDAIPDLSKGVGLGGRGQSVLSGINVGIIQAGYPQLVAEQKGDGIVQVVGSGELEGVVIALKPTGKGLLQTDTQTPAGVGMGRGGEFLVTTPDGKQVSIIPAPKDACAVSDTLGHGKPIQMDEQGEVLLTTGDETAIPCMFDPFVLPAPTDLSVGLNLPQDGIGRGHFVYSDGTMQQIQPTVHKPARFVETGLQFEGVEEITHKVDGSLIVQFLGQPLVLKPTFKINQRPLPPDTDQLPKPEIVIQSASSLLYLVPVESCGCVLEQEIEIFSAEGLTDSQ
jgi:hypothetical protein